MLCIASGMVVSMHTSIAHMTNTLFMPYIRFNPQDETYEPYTEGFDQSEGECSVSELAKESSDDDDVAWDESVHGERLIYDFTYETNADLTPWNVAKKHEVDEVFGFYV